LQESANVKRIQPLLFIAMLLSATHLFAQDADLSVVKSGPPMAAAGSDVAFNLTVTNFGPDDAVGVVLNDPIPGGMTFVSLTQNNGPAFTCSDPGVGNNGLVSCSVATFAAGSSADFTFVYHIDPATPPGTFFTNIATVSSQTNDPNSENDSSSASTQTPPPPQADLGVMKTGPNSAGPDTDVVYTITLTNGGPDDAAGVSLQDTLPGDMTFVSLIQNSGPVLSCTTGTTITCTAATFAAGATATFTLTTHIPSTSPTGTIYSNTATVTSNTSDPDPENDSSTTTLSVSQVDLSLSKSGPTTAFAGTNISYDLTFSNAGPDTAVKARFLDSLPLNTTFVSLTQNNGPTFSCALPPVGFGGSVDCMIGALGSGASANFTLTLAIGDTLSISNTATSSSDSFDSSASNNSSTANTTVTPLSDVAVTKSGPGSVVAGTNNSYDITLANNGPSTTSVTLNDTLPAGTTFVSLVTNPASGVFTCTTPAVGSGGTISCNVAALSPGQTPSLQIFFHVDPATAAGTTITNTANITSAAGDPNGTNNSSSTSATVATSADVAINKSGPTTVASGANSSYTITLANNGPSNTAVTLNDTLPAGTTFVSLVTNPAIGVFNCTTPAPGSGGTISCTVASLAVGQTPSVQIFFNVDAATNTGTVLTNTATVTPAASDPNAANNSSTTSATVTPVADVAVAKSGPSSVVAGTDSSYSITLSNNGPSNTAVTLNDTLPAGTTFVSLITNPASGVFTCTTPAVGSGGTISCSVASLAVGQTPSLQIFFHLDAATAPGTTLTNTATVTPPATDPNSTNNSSTTSATATANADISVIKSGPATAVGGDNITYTLTVSNAGPASAAAVALNDTLPPFATFVSLTQNSGPTFNCVTPAVGSSGTVTCTAATLAPGASANFSLVVAFELAATGPISNTATVSSTTADAAPGNNSSTTSLTATFSTAVPALSPLALLLLAIACAIAGTFALKAK
jgi:uncharacterized repeat protein (TIGR01451 family)